jgi:hypothetical protein
MVPAAHASMISPLPIAEGRNTTLAHSETMAHKTALLVAAVLLIQLQTGQTHERLRNFKCRFRLSVELEILKDGTLT